MEGVIEVARTPNRVEADPEVLKQVFERVTGAGRIDILSRGDDYAFNAKLTSPSGGTVYGVVRLVAVSPNLLAEDSLGKSVWAQFRASIPTAEKAEQEIAANNVINAIAEPVDIKSLTADLITAGLPAEEASQRVLEALSSGALILNADRKLSRPQDETEAAEEAE